MKTGILEGTFEPGEPLVEAQLAAWLQISRTPVREALSRLAQDGMIERTERGHVVKRWTPEEILDLYEVRVVLESMAARMAAERQTLIDRARLTKRLERWERVARAADVAALTTADRDLHRVVWIASHNLPLLDLLERLALHLVPRSGTTLTAPGRLTSSRAEHRILVESILARDADAAAEIATRHFTTALKIRLERVAEEGLSG